MVLKSVRQFFYIFILLKIGQENVSRDILQRKKVFLAYKNKHQIQIAKKLRFFKGVSPWFWFKIGHFSNFSFLRNIEQENVFYDILQRNKNSFVS